ncbi:MAG TPA: hypothetical protein VIL20_06625 [Sandaracinaceae bacterium]
MLDAVQAAAARCARGPRFARSLDSACARLVRGIAPSNGAMEVRMLKIYDVILDIVRALRSTLEQVAHHDPDLARQM